MAIHSAIRGTYHPGSGIFEREWSNANVRMDCDTWNGTITPKTGLGQSIAKMASVPPVMTCKKEDVCVRVSCVHCDDNMFEYTVH